MQTVAETLNLSLNKHLDTSRYQLACTHYTYELCILTTKKITQHQYHLLRVELMPVPPTNGTSKSRQVPKLWPWPGAFSQSPKATEIGWASQISWLRRRWWFFRVFQGRWDDFKMPMRLFCNILQWFSSFFAEVCNWHVSALNPLASNISEPFFNWFDC